METAAAEKTAARVAAETAKQAAMKAVAEQAALEQVAGQAADKAAGARKAPSIFASRADLESAGGASGSRARIDEASVRDVRRDLASSNDRSGMPCRKQR